MTAEQIVEVLTKIKMLDPILSLNYTDEQLITYVGIANITISVSGIEIPEDVLILAVAVKTLALLYIPENSSLSTKKIKDVEVSYYQGQGKNKWDMLFDSIILGTIDDEKRLYYVGI